MVYMMPNWIAACLCLFMIASYSRHTAGAIDVTYDELVELKVACGDLDSCQGNRTTDDMRVVNCQCGPVCAELGTCCVDSEYRTPGVDQVNSRFVATKLYGDVPVVFIVRDCKPDWNGDQGIKDLCAEGGGASFNDDLFLSIPVTNIKSGITYGNYYCFACNEDDSFDSPVLWRINLFTDAESDSFAIVGNVSENLNRADIYNSFTLKDINLWGALGVPAELHKHVNWYRLHVIGWCHPEWTDVTIKEKCEAYTALVYYYEEYRSPLYKNPHCAICNYKKDDLVCSQPYDYRPIGEPPYRYLMSGVFDFNDKVKKCGRNQVFDRHSKKCRYFKCGRNKKLEGIKCVDSVAA